MSGFKKESQLLIDYKKADPKTKKDMLAATIEAISRLPVCFENDTQATETNKKMFDSYQLLNYVDYVQRLETQQAFDISFDPSTLIKLFGANNDYFECTIDDESQQKKLILKRPIFAIPTTIWMEFKKALHLNINLNVRDVFAPPKDAYPYEWYRSNNYDMRLYELEQTRLTFFAKQVLASAENITYTRRVLFTEAIEKLMNISEKIGNAAHVAKTISAQDEKEGAYQEITKELLKINKEAVNLFSTEEDTAVIAVQQTVFWLQGEFPTEIYQDIINNMHQHATLRPSSPAMNNLLTAMITLCALSLAIGITAVALPTFGIIAAGAGSANVAIASAAGLSASLFAGGAMYAFFTDNHKQPEEHEAPELTGLPRAMTTTVETLEKFPDVVPNLMQPTMVTY
jgi:hypothetical protein